MAAGLATPRVARKRLYSARRRRDATSRKAPSLKKAREAVRKADKNLKMARAKSDFCRGQYKLAKSPKRR